MLLGEVAQIQQGSAKQGGDWVGAMQGQRLITCGDERITHNTQSLITVTVIVVIFCSRPKEWKWGGR